MFRPAAGRETGEGIDLAKLLIEHIGTSQYLHFAARVIFACLLGAIIGIERSRHFKEAGLRTHIIACVGAALMMIVSKYGFADLVEPDGALFPGVRDADPARIAAQVVSGISFLGAGVIFKREGLVRGLTTAAGIWITSGIGLAIGAGLIFLSIVVTVLLCVLQILIYRYFSDTDGAVTFVSNQLHFTVRNGYDFHQALIEQIDRWHGVVQESAYTRNQEEGTTDYDLIVQRRKEISYAEMKEFITAHDEIISCTNNAARK